MTGITEKGLAIIKDATSDFKDISIDDRGLGEICED
jgi:hypothetical protein